MGLTKTDDSRYGRLRSNTPPQGSAMREELPRETWAEQEAPQEAPQEAYREVLAFRTRTPIPYLERDAGSGLELDVSLTFEGTCEWSVCDAALFRRDCAPGPELNELLENEVCAALPAVLVNLSGRGIPFAALPDYSEELGAALDEGLFARWRELRGIRAEGFRLLSAVPSNEDAERLNSLKALEELRDPSKAAEALLQKQREAIEAAGGWFCPDCGTANNGPFCSGCGRERPERPAE